MYFILTKIEEILQTGDLQRIRYEQTKDVEVTRLFQGIYGVGMPHFLLLSA
jgi:DNA polymerase lambda